MKKIFITLFATLLVANSYSQKRIANVAPCASDKLFEKSIRENPRIALQLEELERQYKKETEKLEQRRLVTPQMITIPVVFYVVSPGSTDVSNIPNSQITAQLTTLNSYFAAFNIQFCVATKLGTNSSLPLASGTFLSGTNSGIIRVFNPSIANHNISTAGQQALIGGSVNSQITAQKFLRIWIVKDILEDNVSTGVLGYSPVPLTNSVLDGVVIKYNVVGSVSNCTNCPTNYNQGKTLVHEVGHYLNLFHTFHEGCLGSELTTCADNGDRVCDTPQSANPIANCNAAFNSCPENPDNDDLTNFMGYAFDPCKTSFTTGQGVRMNAVINSFRPVLVSVDNLVDVGACSSNLISSAITATSYQACSNYTITFYSPYNDITTYSYSWNFGDPSNPGNTATTPAANHAYTSAINSPYTVTLTVTRNSDGVSSTSTKKVFVTACQPIVNSQGTWIVGFSNLLNFSSGVPVFDQVFPTDIPMSYTSSTQNDNFGNLLFYTNKFDVYKNDNTTINTGGITITNNEWIGESGTAMIVPKPNDANKYYIFSNTRKSPKEPFNNSHGFRFSEIQVNSGTAVMNSIRQPIMDASVSSFFEVQQGALYNGAGVTAIKRRANLSDESYWIITNLRGVDGKTYVVVFLFGSGGTITYQSRFESPFNYSDNILTLKAAPNGNKLFMFGFASNIAYIMDFNKVTGVVSDAKVLNYTYNGAFNEGASFSPDSNLLFFTESQKIVSQVNLNAVNPGQTKVVVVQESYPSVMSQMQLGPDGKIYITGPYSDCLKVIHNPNNLCTQTNYNNCNYYYYGPKLTNGFPELGFALPNNIDAQQSTAYTNNSTSISSYITGCNTYKFFPNYYGTSFSWDFGDTASGSNNTSTASNPTHTFIVGTNPQYTFTVSLKNSAGTVIAQKQIIINNPVYTITGSTLACTSSINNSTNNYINISDGDTVVWSITGAGVGGILGNNQPNVQVNWTTLPGTLTATVTTKAGCTKTISVTINQLCCQENIVLNSVESVSNTVYNANNSITTETNYTLNPSVTTTLKSGKTIVLKPNTYIKKNSSFLAILETCEGNQLVNKSIVANVAMAQPIVKNNYARSLMQDGQIEENGEIVIKNSVSMYPNPSNRIVTIFSSIDKIVKLSVISIDGKEILSQDENDNSLELNVSNFSKGLYIISIETANGEIISKKLIKK